jgi:hypothetical protein
MVIVESAGGGVSLVYLESQHWGSYWDHTGPLRHIQAVTVDRGSASLGYAASPWHRAYRVPHWLLVVLLGALAALPWVKWSWRFSLRTLLVVMTIVAIGLGLMASILK